MTSRSSTALAVLGLLAGFVNVDAFSLFPAAPGGMSSSLTRAKTEVASLELPARNTWRARHGLSMSSTSSAVENVGAATGEVDDSKPPRASVMDELDAILGDVQQVRVSPSDTCDGLLSRGLRGCSYVYLRAMNLWVDRSPVSARRRLTLPSHPANQCTSRSAIETPAAWLRALPRPPCAAYEAAVMRDGSS